MKPGRFEYFAPTKLEEVLELLSERTGEAAVLAGGQSLVPAMNFRLANPAVLVDINRLEGFGRVFVERGELVIDALVRHLALESAVAEDPLGRLLAQISRFVGHLPIRVRGTFVGSIAHADPAAEWCMLAAALDSTIVARSVRGERHLSAGAFFEGPYQTVLEPDEVITQVRLPLLGGGGAGFREKTLTAGDFATVATVATLSVDDGTVRAARIGVAGAQARPARVIAAEEVLAGAAPTPDALAAAGRVAAENIEPVADAFCSADYRRHLVRVLVTRALGDAAKDAAA